MAICGPSAVSRGAFRRPSDKNEDLAVAVVEAPGCGPCSARASRRAGSAVARHEAHRVCVLMSRLAAIPTRAFVSINRHRTVAAAGAARLCRATLVRRGSRTTSGLCARSRALSEETCIRRRHQRLCERSNAHVRCATLGGTKRALCPPCFAVTPTATTTRSR